MTKFDFFYSSWKYLIVFCFRLNNFASKISNFFVTFGGWGHQGPGSVNLDIPFEVINVFSNTEKVSKTISIVLLFVREYHKFPSLS